MVSHLHPVFFIKKKKKNHTHTNEYGGCRCSYSLGSIHSSINNIICLIIFFNIFFKHTGEKSPHHRILKRK